MIDDITEVPPPSEIGGEDAFLDDKTTFKYKRLKDRVPGESWILLVYGASKTGKTFFAGTSGPRTLYLNTGEGLETLLAPAFTQKYPAAAEGIITVDLREELDIPTVFDKMTDSIDHALKNFPHLFDTVVLDDATFTRQAALRKAMSLNTAARKSGTRASRQDEYVKAEIGDYGTEMDMIEWFFAEYIPRFKGAQKHFICLAHERQIFNKPEKQGDEPSLKRVLPAFTGKQFPDKVPAYFDDVMRSEVALDASGNAAYKLRTAGNDQMLGGTRHGGIFRELEVNPNFHDMLNRIKLAQVAKPFQLKR